MKAVHLLVIASLITVGCSSSETETRSTSSPETSEQAESETPSLDTPEAVFAQFKNAMQDEDWESAITLINRESQEMMVMGMVMQAAFMTMEDESKGKELEAIFAKHGLEELTQDDPNAEPVDFDALSEKLPAFVGEVADWIADNSEGEDEGFPEMGELSGLSIEGDKATATVSTEMGDQPIEFQKIDGQWKLNLAMGPPPPPSIDELGFDFEDSLGEIGSMTMGDNEVGLNHAFAYRGQFFEDPCIVLVLSAEPVSEEKRSELQAQIKEDPENVMFFPEGANVTLTMTPEGDLMSMFAWVDNTSISGNRGPAVDVTIDGDSIIGRVGMAPEEYGDNKLQFQAKFETEIAF